MAAQHPVHLREHRRAGHQLVGQQHRERFVADGLAGAPDGVAEAFRVVLVDDVDTPVAPDRTQPFGGVRLAFGFERVDERLVGGEVGVEGRLRTAADDHDVVAPGSERLVDDQLDRRPIADREQLLRNGFRCRKETGSQTGRRDDSTAYLHGSDDILLCPMPTYVYKFVETGETIEVQQGFHDENLTEIAHPDTGEVLPVKKVFTPVGVTFKGSGFFKTDNRGKSSVTTPSTSSTTADSKGGSTSSSDGGSSSSESTGSGSSSTAKSDGSGSSGSSSSSAGSGAGSTSSSND